MSEVLSGAQKPSKPDRVYEQVVVSGSANIAAEVRPDCSPTEEPYWIYLRSKKIEFSFFLDVEEFDKYKIIEFTRDELMDAVYNQLPIEEYMFRNFKIVFEKLKIRRENGECYVISEDIEVLSCQKRIYSHNLF